MIVFWLFGALGVFLLVFHLVHDRIFDRGYRAGYDAGFSEGETKGKLATDNWWLETERGAEEARRWIWKEKA